MLHSSDWALPDGYLMSACARLSVGHRIFGSMLYALPNIPGALSVLRATGSYQ